MEPEDQLTFEDDPTNKGYHHVFELIRSGRFGEAYSICESFSLQTTWLPEIYPLMKALKFWLNRQVAITEASPGLMLANYLRGEWSIFEKFVTSPQVESQTATPRFKEAIFTRIVENYVLAFQQGQMPDPELLLSLSEALVENKQYEKAKETLLYAKRFKNKESRLLALLGDVYHFLGEEKLSLLTFREAFFYQPQKISLNLLKSPVILGLATRTSEEGFAPHEIALWLPIRAELENVFSEKRGLSESEVKQLEKDIIDLELDFEIRRKDRAEVEPILLNHYFFLLHHLLSISEETTEDASRLAHVLQKIKAINPTIYEKLKQ